jgi:subfamily B ATP-binding cassette protein HlyB/CyaB
MDSLLFSSASFAWGLHNICRLHRIPFAPKILLQQVPPPYSIYSFQHAAEAIGFHSVLRDAALSEIPSLPLPCLAVLKPTCTPVAAATNADSVAACGMALLLKIEDGRLAYLKEGEENPTTCLLEEFSSQYAGVVLLFERETSAAASPDEIAPGTTFGFRWFFPEV